MKILLRKFGKSFRQRQRQNQAESKHTALQGKGSGCALKQRARAGISLSLRDDTPAVLHCSAQCLAKQGLLRAQLVEEAARFATGALSHIRTLGLLRDSQR